MNNISNRYGWVHNADVFYFDAPIGFTCAMCQHERMKFVIGLFGPCDFSMLGSQRK